MAVQSPGYLRYSRANAASQRVLPNPNADIQVRPAGIHKSVHKIKPGKARSAPGFSQKFQGGGFDKGSQMIFHDVKILLISPENFK
jgi:hypothetical protein